ncbi:MAG: peptidylprolyl isomerase [Turicibacter sp.]|nr:peptidylprolyl isomerase [Turicibacter sp.]
MKKYFLATAALATTLLLGACSKNNGIGMTLPNGDEKFITSDVANITKQEVFEEMVHYAGLPALLDLVDYDVLSQKYEINTAEIDDTIAKYKELYPEFDDFLAGQGFKDEEALRQYLALNLYRKAAAYAQITVTDEEIQKAYDTKYSEIIVTDEEGANEEVDVEEDVVEAPALEDVKDEIKQELIQSKLTNELIVSTLATEREEAGFTILNDYLETQYTEVSATYEEVKETSDSIVAKTNDAEYTIEQLYNELLPAYGLSQGISLIDGKLLENKYKPDEKSIKELIDQFKVAYGTSYYTVMASAGLTTDEEIYEYFKLAHLQDAALAEAYPITDERLQADYDAYHKKLKARHILVENEETAKEIIAKLDAAEDKEATFKELAAEYGTDSTKSNGGDLGAFDEGQMVAEFENATKALEVNTYTAEPVQTQFGYHVIYRYDDPRSFEEMKEELKSAAITSEYTQLRLEMLLINLRSEANFTFTDEVLQQRYEKIVANIATQAAAEEAARTTTSTTENETVTEEDTTTPEE